MHRVAALKDHSARLAVAAGTFYPADAEQCRRAAHELVFGAALRGPLDRSASRESSGRRAMGGIVPHAGWVCSGPIAGQTIAELARRMGDGAPDVVVVFGAVHTPVEIDRAALESHESWQVPGGQSMTARDLAKELAGQSGLFVEDDRFHRHEHAVEVEVPLIQAAWPRAMLLPIEVPLINEAEQIGRETAQRVLARGGRAVFLASSDLTHYGPEYRLTVAGVGIEALEWAKENDRRLLQVVTDFAVERIVPEVRARSNACGGGAIAAMLAACREAGATTASVLRQTNSYEMLAGLARNDAANAVGYASVVVS